MRHQIAVGPIPDGTPFNVRPCRRDPVFWLLKDVCGLSPLAGAGFFLLLYVGGNLFFTSLSGTARSGGGAELPYLEDRVALIVHAFFAPLGALLALRFYRQTEVTFELLFRDGIIRAPRDEYRAFLQRLDRRYNAVALHLLALLLGLMVLGFWQFQNERDQVRSWRDFGMGPGSLYHVVVALVAWYSAPLLMLKAAITARAMQQVFDWPVNIQPFHPDGCGGLKLFTDISVTIALFTAVAASAVVVYIMSYAATAAGWLPWIAVFLLMLTPLIFLTCLYRAHEVMGGIKDSLLRQINDQVHPNYEEMCRGLERGEVMSEAATEVLRLEQLHAFARRLPLWPTNTQIVAQIVLSVAVPLALLILQFLIQYFTTNASA